MKLLPIIEVNEYGTYNHPPTKKDGGRMAIITRDVMYGNRVLLKKGTQGTVIALNSLSLLFKFKDYNDWLRENSITSYSNYLYERASFNRTYDFFHTFTKNGKTKVGTWHTHISQSDFQYIEPNNHSSI